jgi:hypothetical protein
LYKIHISRKTVRKTSLIFHKRPAAAVVVKRTDIEKQQEPVAVAALKQEQPPAHEKPPATPGLGSAATTEAAAIVEYQMCRFGQILSLSDAFDWKI